MWGFGSASCYDAVARTYYDAHLEQMRSQYRELPIPRHLPPFIPPSFEEFMRDQQQHVEQQQEREAGEAIRDVSEIAGKEDVNWLWSFGSSVITDESDAFLPQASSMATPSSNEGYSSLKRFVVDDQLNRPSKPSCIDWLVNQSNAISERLYLATQQPHNRRLCATSLEADPIGFDQILPSKLHDEVVELKHFEWKTLELPHLETEHARGSMSLQALKTKSSEYFRKCIGETDSAIVRGIETANLLREWPTNTVNLSLHAEIEYICSSYQTKDEQKKCSALQEKPSMQSTKLPQKYRLDSDYSYMGIPDAALKKQSAQILKKMIRCNAQISLLLQPKSSLDIFNVTQKQICVWHLMHGVLAGGATKPSSEGMLQQILLPSCIARGDDSKLDGALETIIVNSQQIFRKLMQEFKVATASEIRTLKNSSLWNEESIKNAGADWIQEKPNWEIFSEVKLACLVLDVMDESQVKQAAAMPMFHINQSNEQKLSQGNNGRHEISANMVEVQKLNDKEENRLETDAKFLNDIPISTDDLVSSFFCVGKSNELVLVEKNHESPRRCEKLTNSNQDQGLTDSKLIYQLIRPVLWDLVRKKILRVNPVNIQVALNQISLDVLELIIFKLHAKLKDFSLNPSIASHEEIVDACSSFRQVVWLHSLRMIQLCPQTNDPDKNAPKELVKQMRSSLIYRKAIGPSHGKDLCRLYDDEINSVNSNTTSEIEKQRADTSQQMESDLEPPAKKRRILVPDEEQDKIPVRVLCSVGFLSKEGLLDELCSDQGISIIERDLPEPIDLIIDERNGACAIDASLFEDASQMKSLTFKLAAVQMQFQKVWIVIYADDPDVFKRVEPNLHAFYTALVNFRVEVQPMTSSTDEETGSLIRYIIDQCAKDALEEHRTLPQMWYQRPYLLDEESQHERFLASTQILNHFSAQSLLHKISTDDLFTSSFADLKAMVQDSVSEHQLTLLWGMLHQPHGIQQ